MNRTKEVKKIFGGKFVKLYDVTYTDKNGKDRLWRFASRRNKTLAETGIEKADAVVIVPLYLGENSGELEEFEDIKFVVTKEYRAPLGGYEYGLPAGLIDGNETIEEAVERELFEETGLRVSKVVHITPPLYSSAGLSDESTSIVFVECYGIPSTDGNKDSEDIEISLVSYEDMSEFIESGKEIFPDGRIGVRGYLAWMYMITSAY